MHISTPLNIVSGATGFLGAHVVCQLLMAGKPVRALQRKNSNLKEFESIYAWYIANKTMPKPENQQLQWYAADLLDIDTLNDALNNAGIVYHCAAMVSFEPTHRDEMMKINVEGTANIVNLCLLKKVSKFCYVSSIASLGRKKSGEMLDESVHWEDSNLNSNYAISKYKAELEVWRAAEEGLNVVMVNPGVIIGIGDYTKGSNNLIESIYKGMPLFSMGVNGYVDVRDVAKAMLLLVEKNMLHKRFVLVAENWRIRDLFFAIADGFGKKRPSIEVKPWMAAIAWRVMWVKRLFSKKGITITKETARAAINESYYSSQKIISELEFSFIPIKQTISDCCTFYLNQKK